MKRKTAGFLSVLLIFALAVGLGACGFRQEQPASAGSPAPVSESPSAAPASESPSAAAPSATAPSPTASPTPPAGGAPTPAPPANAPTAAASATVQTGGDLTGLALLLAEVYANYHSGTAGSSLTAAKYAGAILDWYDAAGAAGNADARSAAAEFAARQSVSGDTDFAARLLDVYRVAAQFGFGTGLDILNDCGYDRVSMAWSPDKTETLFAEIYAGTGLSLPTLIRVYYPDGTGRFLTSTVPAEKVNAQTVFSALQTAGVVGTGVSLTGSDVTGRALRLELDSAFSDQLASLDAASKSLRVGCLVNTYLDAFSADSVTVTAGGAAVANSARRYTA